jgi:hypothetical protein
MKNVLINYKPKPGYAETATRKYPKEPEIVVVGEKEIAKAVCQGAHCHPDGNIGWLRFKIPGKRRYYFQLHPW